MPDPDDQPVGGLQPPQIVEHSVEHADIFIGGNDGRAVPIDAHAADYIALTANLVQVQIERGDHGGTLRCPKYKGAIPSGTDCRRGDRAEQAGEGALQLPLRDHQHGRISAM
jgi:hypothetical protein